MGASSSNLDEDPELSAAESALPAAEVDRLRASFGNVLLSSSDEFQVLCGGPLGARLFAVLQREASSFATTTYAPVTYRELAIFAARFTSTAAADESKTSFAFELLRGSSEGAPSVRSLTNLVSDCSAYASFPATTAAATPAAAAAAMSVARTVHDTGRGSRVSTSSAGAPPQTPVDGGGGVGGDGSGVDGSGGSGGDGSDGDGREVTRDEFERWMERTPALHATLRHVAAALSAVPPAQPPHSPLPPQPQDDQRPPQAEPQQPQPEQQQAQQQQQQQQQQLQQQQEQQEASEELQRLPRGWPGLMPQCDLRGLSGSGGDGGGGGGPLLQPAWLWALAPHLPPASALKWTLLFSSPEHGASFRTLSARCAGRGAVAVLVRERADAPGGAAGVAMGFSDAPLQKGTAFAGGYGSFVASMLPHHRIFRPSGSNSNFVYMAEDYASVPNGLAFGGQVGHHALFLESAFEQGHSRMSATYDSPPLLGCAADGGRFRTDCVEVWAADWSALSEFEEAQRRAARRAAQVAAGGGSAMDRFAQDRAFLTIATGRATQSDGLRNAPPEES